MAGVGTAGEPNGIPIDEWGIRMEEGSCNPLGSKTSRGGEANGPAAVYAIAKWDEWLREYAPAGRGELRLLPVAAGAQPGQRRPADLLVHRLPRRHGQAAVRGQQHRRRRRQPALARRALAARPLLAGRPEGRLPGRRLLDDPALDAGRPRQGRLALRAVRHLEDRRHQEEPRRADLRPRHARSAARASPSARRSSAASSSSTARPTGCAGRRPASTCPTTRSWRRSGGSRSAT